MSDVMYFQYSTMTFQFLKLCAENYPQCQKIILYDGQEGLDENGLPHGRVQISLRCDTSPSGFYKQSKGRMDHGKRTDIWREYGQGDDGSFADIPYKDDKKNGCGFFYDAKGDLTDIVDYIDDKKNGWHIKPFPNNKGMPGKIRSKAFYKDDIKDGIEYFYKSDGSLDFLCVHNRGLFDEQKTGKINASLHSMQFFDNVETSLKKIAPLQRWFNLPLRPMILQTEKQIEKLSQKYPQFRFQ